MIKPITIVLYEQTQTGVDGFGRPIYEEAGVEVPGVLVAPMSDQEILDTLNLTGRRAIYQLALPKGDSHDWTDKRVGFFGENWRVIGLPQEGIEANIPLSWNRKIRVERYE